MDPGAKRVDCQRAWAQSRRRHQPQLKPEPQAPAPVGPEPQEPRHQFTQVGIFDFMGAEFTGYMDEESEPWLINNEVCAYLELGNPRQAIADLESFEKDVHTIDTPGGLQLVTLLSESGLYELAFKSKKPNAKAFRKWARTDVFPSIRKTGSYSRQLKNFPTAA
jgi:prophage antirepressor-like protein